MEPQGRGSVSPIRTTKRNRTLGRRKSTLGSRVHVQTVRLNAENKKGSAPSRRGDVSLDIPFYRTPHLGEEDFLDHVDRLEEGGKFRRQPFETTSSLSVSGKESVPSPGTIPGGGHRFLETLGFEGKYPPDKSGHCVFQTRKSQDQPYAPSDNPRKP